MPRGRIAHTRLATDAIYRCAEDLLRDGTASTPEEAVRIACATLDGAGDHEGWTVESMQTCTDLEGRPVREMSTNDCVDGREDEFSDNELLRHEVADMGGDVAERWLEKNDSEYRKTRHGWRF